MPQPRRSFLLFLLTAMLSLPAAAEVSTRECIQIQPPPGPAYVIPAHTQVTLLTMGFALNDASNAIFAAQIFFPDAASQTLANTARFDLLVDGSTAGRLTTPIQYFTRTPDVTQGIVSVRAFYQNLAATTITDHTLTLVVNNTSGRGFVVHGAYANALFVDAAELAAGSYSNSTQTVGAGYSTIGQITIPAVSNRHFFVSSHIRGSAPTTMTFRYLVNGVVSEKKTVNFNNLDNGTIVDWLAQNAVAGQQIALQAKANSGTGSVIVVEMAGQAMQTYSVLGYSQDNVYTSSAAGLSWINYGAAPGALPPQVLFQAGSLSLSGPPTDGGQSTCQWGTTDSNVSISPGGSEVILTLGLLANDVLQSGYDLGLAGYSPLDATFAGYRQQTDFGCGGALSAGTKYGVQQGVNNLCSTSPTWWVAHQRLQVVVLPAPCVAGRNCAQKWTDNGCELDNHTCTTQTRMAYGPGTACYGVPCAHQCTLNLTPTTTSLAGVCN
jgi:hypothetical protein